MATDLLPTAVAEDIKRYLAQRAERSRMVSWNSSAADEDALTGDLFGQLRTSTVREKLVDGRLYQWRVDYTKLIGRGKNAPEKQCGADGIFELEVADDQGSLLRKGLPFQAKVEWKHRNGDLLEQVQKMERVIGYAGAVFDYGPVSFTATNGSNVINSDGRPPDDKPSLGEYLGRVVECTAGHRGLYYDASRGILVNGERMIRFNVRHRARVVVETWAPGFDVVSVGRSLADLIKKAPKAARKRT